MLTKKVIVKARVKVDIVPLDRAKSYLFLMPTGHPAEVYLAFERALSKLGVKGRVLQMPESVQFQVVEAGAP